NLYSSSSLWWWRTGFLRQRIHLGSTIKNLCHHGSHFLIVECIDHVHLNGVTSLTHSGKRFDDVSERRIITVCSSGGPIRNGCVRWKSRTQGERYLANFGLEKICMGENQTHDTPGEIFKVANVTKHV